MTDLRESMDRMFTELEQDTARPQPVIPVSLKHYQWCEKTGRPWWEYFDRDQSKSNPSLLPPKETPT